MKTTEIKAENAVKAYESGTDKQKEFLKNLLGEDLFVKDIRDQIKTMDDVFRLNGTSLAEFTKKWEGFASHEIGHAIELLIVSAYNQGQLPDFSNSNQDKYYPRFLMDSGSRFAYSYFVNWHTTSLVGSRQVFLSYDNMIDAVEKFLPQYKQSRTT